MTVKIISDEKTWQRFVTTNCSDTFLQSWEWGDFQQALGAGVWRLGVFDNSRLVACALVIKVVARRGRFLLVPHGPIVDTGRAGGEASEKTRDIMAVLKTYLIEMGNNASCHFIRIAPIFPRLPEYESLFHSLGFVRSPIHVHSEQSWLVDIKQPEQALLAGMRKSTRYIVNHNGPGGVVVRQETTAPGFGKFFSLYEQTVLKHGYVGFDKNYLYKEFGSFLKNGAVRLFFAYSNNGAVSAAFVILYGQSGFYHHGASVADSKVPASQLLHWQIIKELKKEGFSYYNFWGVAPEDKLNHPWRGLTVFKKGFGGEERQYLQTQDLVLSAFYWFNWLVETARRLKRGY